MAFDLTDLALRDLCDLIVDDGSLSLLDSGAPTGAAGGQAGHACSEFQDALNEQVVEAAAVARNLSSSSLLSEHSAAALCHGLGGVTGAQPMGARLAARLSHVQPVQAQLAPAAKQPSAASLLRCGEDEEFGAAVSRAPVVSLHSSSEKQRRDRLNTLIDQLAAIVPPCTADTPTNAPSSSHAAAGGATRRPKHQVLLDTIHALTALQHKVAALQCMAGGGMAAAGASCGGASTPPASASASGAGGDLALGIGNEPGGAAAGGGRGMVSPRRSWPAMDFPLPLDVPTNSTGVTVEADAGSLTWRLRVTCRDRPGLMGDVANALRGLPLTVRAASLTTTRDGKAQQVYEVQLLDASLAPEELQCAVNAALYAHLLAPPPPPPPVAPEAPPVAAPPAKRARNTE